VSYLSHGWFDLHSKQQLFGNLDTTSLFNFSHDSAQKETSPFLTPLFKSLTKLLLNWIDVHYDDVGVN